MKKTSKTIALIGLSLLAVGTFAQSENNKTHIQRNIPKIHKGVVLGQKHSPSHFNKVTTATPTIQVDYVSIDNYLATVNGQYSLTTLNSWFSDQINARFTLADTNASVPALEENESLVQNAIVAFDTIMDQNGNSYNSQAPMVIDTLWVGTCWYKNTSGQNDTLVFSIDSVTAKTASNSTNFGYPTLTAYKTYSVVLHKNVTFTIATPSGNLTYSFAGNNLDTGNSMLCIPNFTLPRNHTKFAVNISFYGSKADTFELGFGFPLNICGGSCDDAGNPYANPFTYVGYLFTSPVPSTIPVNSYANGWLYDYPNTTMLPEKNGEIFSAYGDTYLWNTCGSGVCNLDTNYFYEQDYAIYASVTFNNVTAIDNIADNGLSVGQNYPNPFGKTTQITYNLLNSSDVVFTLCDVTGRVIINNVYNSVEPGQHEIDLNANTFAPGIYFYTFKVNGNEVTKKMVVTE